MKDDQTPATVSAMPRRDDRALRRTIGARVRELRHAAETSIGDLSAAAGISAGMLSKIETGQISPSLGTLQALARALAVPLSSLFAAFEERRDASFVAAGNGLVIERRGTKVGHVYQLLGASLRGDLAVEPYLITLDPDAVPYAGFAHRGVEFIHMLTGEVIYRHGEQTYPLKPGDSLLFDSGALHGPEKLNKLPSTFLSVIVYSRSA